ncbi:MAG TPA: hypothetical protein VF756_00165 [Thermoanaerobaculia bacterium]
MTGSRLLVGNLLGEDDLARLLHAGDPRRRRERPPSQTVLRTASRLATFLRAFAREGDRLWTPAPVDPEELPQVPGVPIPILESGPLERIEPAEEVLAWCETPAAAALRTRPRDPGVPWDAPLQEILWRLPTAPPSVVARVHHRAFHLQIAEELGCALPGARMVDSLGELDRTLSSSEAPASWVVKAPLSASGRERYIERNGPHLAEPKSRHTVERLFERHGPLLFEPWLDRIADYGCAVLLTEAGMRIASLHSQRVDLKGQFSGIDLEGFDLPAPDRERMDEVVEGVARALCREGYAGPFGIDAWSYRRPDGGIAFHPLGEINARMTFGLVAQTLAERDGGYSASRFPGSGFQAVAASFSAVKR